MKNKILIIHLLGFLSFHLSYSQNSISAGKGSFAEYPPEAIAYEDGYFAAPYNWFEQAWPYLNLHDNVRNRSLPTNKWWTEFIFRGLGRVQPEYHQPPVTVTTDGDRFGCEAWAYPHMVTASQNGFNIFFPKGFSGGGMIKGTPLKINAATALQANDENVLFADFESSTWPEGWQVSGNTKNIRGPMATAEISQSPTPSGYVGDRFVNTYLDNDAKIVLASPQFTIQKDYIRLYVGGGNHPEEAYVGLFINGVKILSETGENSGNLTQRTWNVAEYKGQQAEIRIVDQSTAGWGFILCDEIIFTNSPYGGSGYTADFKTSSAKVYDWTDIGFTLRSEMDNKLMDATIVHGVPFVYIELNNLYPILTADATTKIFDQAGQEIENFPASLSAFCIEYNDRIFGIHLPSGSKIHKSKGGDFQIETTGKKSYLVVSLLPQKSLLATYDKYARNKPENIQFNYTYKVEEGKIETIFDMDAKNLDTGATKQETLMSFLPHHYRSTTKNFEFIQGADYPMFIGMMHTGAAKSFSLTYNFGGMPPYLPEPLDLSQERTERLNSLLTYSSQHISRNGNSYAKGFGEQTTMMLMAKAIGHNGFDLFKSSLKDELSDWLTFDETERTQKSNYFVRYPKYGALIGFPPGYGSQGFNDLHFHNGYFTVGAARLMMVDKEFKRDFAEMTKLITKTYANWERTDTADDGSGNYQPFLRTFDPYLGHSFAGGTGDGGGNNQESTSEAINSWFGLYLLGVELNDKNILDCGAMGYLLENLTAGEYWLDMYNDNFPTTYEHEYVGILRTDNLAWATYFSGDPAWVLGIQACPVDFYYQSFSMDTDRMKEINAAMFHDRTTSFYNGSPLHPNDDPYDNIKSMGPYLGGYHLNIMNHIDPKTSADWIELLCQLPGQAGEEWRNQLNTTTNYYMSNAMATYGRPAQGYHTSIPSGAVYKNEAGELTYLLYNSTDKEANVAIYKDGEVIESIKVGAKKFYNSRIAEGSKPSATILSHKENDKMALNKEIKLKASASDKDGSILWVDFYLDDKLIGTSYVEPYEIAFKPTKSGIRELKVIATDDDSIQSEPTPIKVEILSTEQTAFGGRSSWKIPSEQIFAVQFDEGGIGIAYHDNELEMQGGDNYRAGTGVETENTNNLENSNIGWTNTGEWFEYTVETETSGIYMMSARLSSALGGALRIFVDGVDLTGSVSLDATGAWGDYKDVDVAKIPMEAGKHIVKVMIDRNGFNLNSYNFTLLPDENMPSQVYAGKDVVITLPKSAVELTSSVKTYGTTTIIEYQWTQIDANAPVIIESADQPTAKISALSAGTYIFRVSAIDSNGAISSDEIVVFVKPNKWTTAIESQPIEEAKISVYPNPFSDYLSISMDEMSKYQRIQIFSATGQLVIEKSTAEMTKIDLDLSNLEKGYYILRVISENNTFNMKLMK